MELALVVGSPSYNGVVHKSDASSACTRCTTLMKGGPHTATRSSRLASEELEDNRSLEDEGSPTGDTPLVLA
eukprot:1189611-Prorocentrum_minimum.AAC.5